MTNEKIRAVAMAEIQEILGQGFLTSETYKNDKFLENAKRAAEGMCILTARLLGVPYKDVYEEVVGMLIEMETAAKEGRFC